MSIRAKPERAASSKYVDTEAKTQMLLTHYRDITQPPMSSCVSWERRNQLIAPSSANRCRGGRANSNDILIRSGSQGQDHSKVSSFLYILMWNNITSLH